MDVDPQLVKQTAPGLLGAMGAMFFMRGAWLVRVGMVIPGGALSLYGSAYAATQTGMPEGLAGFVLGLLGMIFFGKIIDTWQDLELGTILKQWLRKLLGIKEAQE